MPHKDVVMAGLQKHFAVLLYLTALAPNGQGQTTSTWLLSGAMDIYIGLDCSGSVSDADYAREKNDTLAFIRQLPVKPNGTWVGVRPFSNDVADTEISLTGNMTILEQGIPNLPRMKGNTDISNFLLVAIGKLMSASTRNVLKCIVIFTDGYSRYPSRVVSAVDLATKNNIQIFAVPVGSRINVPSLNNLVGANNTISSAASLPEDVQTYVQVEEARLAVTYPTTTPFVEATPTGSTLVRTSTFSTFSTGQSPVNTTVNMVYTTSQEYVTNTGLTSLQPKENSTLLAGSSTSQNDGTNTRISSMLPSNSSFPAAARSSQPDVSRTGVSELTATSGTPFEAHSMTGAMSSQNSASTTASIGTSATTNNSTVMFTSVVSSSAGNSTSSELSSVSNSTTSTPSSVGNSTAATGSSGSNSTTPNSADSSTTVTRSLTTATLIYNSTTTTFNSASNFATTLNSAVSSTTAVPSSTSNSTKAEFNSAGNSTTVTLSPVSISTNYSTSRATTSTGTLATPVDNSFGNSSSSTVASVGNFTSGVVSSVINSFSGSVNSFGTSAAEDSITRASSSSSLSSSSPISGSNVSVSTFNSSGNATSSPSQSFFTSATTTVNSGGNDSLTATSQGGNPILGRSTSSEVSATNTVNLLSNSTIKTVNSFGNSTSAPTNSLSNFTVSTANSVNTATSVAANSAGTTTTTPSAAVNSPSSARSSTDKSTITAVIFSDNSTTSIVTSLGNSTSAATNAVSNFTLSAASSAGSFHGSMANVDGTLTTANLIGNYTSNANSSFGSRTSGPNSSVDISTTAIRSVGNATSSTLNSIGASTFSITNLAGSSTAATSLTSTKDTSPSSANVKSTYSFASTTTGNNSSGDLTASTHLVAGNKSDVTQTPVATGFTEKRNSDLSSAGAPSATERTSSAFTVSKTESIVASSGTTADTAASITVSKSTSDLQDTPSTLPVTMNASTTKNGSHSDVSGPTVIPGGSNTAAGTPFYPDVAMTTDRSTTTPLFNFTNIIDTTRPTTYPELTSSSNTMGSSVTPRADDKTPIGQAGVGVTEPAVRTGTTMDIQTGHETISGTSRDVSWPRDWTPTTERGLANVSSERHSSDPNPTNRIPSDTEDTTPPASITDRATTPAKSGGICASKELVVSSGVGHLRHPYRCDLYIQCYKSPDGNVIAVTRQCKPGLLWNPTLGACDWAYNVNCPIDKCRTSSLQNYKMEGNCRAFWSCQQGRSTATCCKPGAAYFPGQGCVTCAKCLDPCPEKCRSGDVCKVRPVWGSPYNYQIDLGLFGWMTSTCFSGTFNLASCSCSIFNTFSTRGCSLYLSLTFNDAVSEYSKIQMNNLLTDRGSAVFAGNSAVTVPFSPADTYLRLAEKPLVLRLRYMELSPLSMLSVLVRSTPCETGGQLVLYADDAAIYVKIFSQQGEVASATLLTEGFVTTIWKTLEVRYMVNQLTVSVTSGSLTYMSSVKIPISLSMADCGWTLGHPVNIRQLRGYTGRMDDVQIFYCTM